MQRVMTSQAQHWRALLDVPARSVSHHCFGFTQATLRPVQTVTCLVRETRIL